MKQGSTLQDLRIAQQELLINHIELAKCSHDLKVANKNLDIGEIEKEKRVTQVNDDLENMMFTISHRVRDSVAKILGISNLLCDDTAISDSELREMLKIIINSAESLNTSTEELSKFIRQKRS